MAKTVHRKSDNKVSLKLSENNTLRLIKLYQSEPCLYDTNSEDYKSRDLRAAALKRISASLSVYGFGPKEVATKFKNLRNIYSQELKKIQDSEGADDAYVPKVYWFTIMDSFLRSQMNTRSSKSNLALEQAEVNQPDGQERMTFGFDDSMNEQVYAENDDENSVPALNEQENDMIPSPLVEGCSSENNLTNERYNIYPYRQRPMLKKPTQMTSKFVWARKRRLTPPRSTPTQERSRDSAISETLEKLNGVAEIASSSIAAKNTSDMYDSFGQFVAGVMRQAGIQTAVVMSNEITNVLMRHVAIPCTSTSTNPSTTNSNPEDLTAS